MVPPTFETHLDDIEDHLLAQRARELAKFLGRSDRPTARRQRGTKREDHVTEPSLFTDRTVDLGLAAEVLADSQKLRLGVADIEARESTPAILAHALVTGESVLHLTEAGQVIGRRRRLGGASHAERVAAARQSPASSLPPDPAGERAQRLPDGPGDRGSSLARERSGRIPSPKCTSARRIRYRGRRCPEGSAAGGRGRLGQRQPPSGEPAARRASWQMDPGD